LPKGDQRQYYFAIRDALLEGAPNPVIPAQAVAVMAILETAIESSENGQVLPLPLTNQERDNYRNERA
jgi:hypothetical protein